MQISISCWNWAIFQQQCDNSCESLQWRDSCELLMLRDISIWGLSAFLVLFAVTSKSSEPNETLTFMGTDFQLHGDITDLKSLIISQSEPIWTRPRTRASEEDCDTLHSEKAPVVLNTHAALFRAGHMSSLPYLFREFCTRDIPTVTPEISFTAVLTNVWIFKDTRFQVPVQ